MIEDPVRVSGGLISGVVEAGGTVRAYKGIPFAAPPVGELRWRGPQPVVPWDGVHIADRFGPVCLQAPMPRDGLLGLFSFDEPPECGMSEDCLYLNVWTGAGSAEERRPVIVWIFGGAHVFGGGSHPVSWGTSLAGRGAVVVTLNYRVGPLGFLAHPGLTRESGASGNYACQDVVAALRWVRDNIAAFGGDPDRVTIYGHSAGAQQVAIMMATPEARGLFHRAIGAAGGSFDGGMISMPMRDLGEAEKSGAELLDRLGARTLDEIRNQPADALYGPIGMWAPIVDGAVLAESVQSVFAAGEQAAVPLITGFTTEEGSTLPLPHLHSVAGLHGYVRSQFGDDADAMLSLYPAADDDAARAASYRMVRDGTFAYQAWRLAMLHCETSAAPVFMYCFGRAVPLPQGSSFSEPVPPGGYGAWHGAELWYAFDTLYTKPFPWQQTDRDLARAMGDALIRFAESGDPGDGWPRFTSQRAEAALFDERGVHAGSLPNHAELTFFTNHYARTA